MKRLKRLGFFRELAHGDQNGPRLTDQKRDHPQPDEPKLVDYVRRGLLLIACPGVTSDVLDNSSNVIGAPHILTDGVWAWPADLAYYMEKYHVALPHDFIDDVRRREFRPAFRADIDLTELEL